MALRCIVRIDGISGYRNMWESFNDILDDSGQKRFVSQVLRSSMTENTDFYTF
jgi:hypothetical protein